MNKDQLRIMIQFDHCIKHCLFFHKLQSSISNHSLLFISCMTVDTKHVEIIDSCIESYDTYHSVIFGIH